MNSVGEATQTNNVILEGLFARTNFQATFGGMETKMHGGLYSPEIAVTASLLLRPQSPFTIPAVYSKMPSDDTNAEELRLKLLHILRFCHAKGHRDLVITGHFTTSAVEVALCFQELLTKSGEVEGIFQRVIFAISQDDGMMGATIATSSASLRSGRSSICSLQALQFSVNLDFGPCSASL